MDRKLRNMTSVYLSAGERILLLFRQGGRVVDEVWVGSAGGHFEPDELNDPRACVLRELEEELGITESQLTDLSLRYITLRCTRGEIRQNYYFFAGLRDSACELPVSNEGITRWFTYPELSGLKMPCTARFVTDHYLKTGRSTNALYVGVADGRQVIFTEMPEY